MIVNVDGRVINVYSDAGEFLWAYNPNYPNMRFGIEKEKVICGYKFTVNDDDSSSFIYIGSYSE